MVFVVMWIDYFIIPAIVQYYLFVYVCIYLFILQISFL